MAEEDQYIAGFLDGDGCVTMESPTTDRRRPAPRVSATQSYNRGEPPELLFLRNRFHGSIRTVKKATNTRRNSWTFRVCESDREKLLSVVADHGIVKRRQAELALDYLVQGKEDPAYFSYEIAREKADVHSTEIDVDRLTMSYLAGLFAAEGSVGLSRNGHGSYGLVSSISQLSCPRLLHAIKEKLGYGYVCGGKINFAPTATVKFLECVQPFIKKSQKRRQIKVAKQFVRYMDEIGRHPGRHKRSEEERKRIERFAKKLAKLKKR